MCRAVTSAPIIVCTVSKMKSVFLQKNDIISHFDGLKIRQEATNFEEEKSTSTKSGGKVIDR